MLASVASESILAGGGSPWWQTIGGLLAVFGLLLLSLKFLAKWNRRQGGSEATVLTVWPLGPKREIQVLRLGEEVHYIYRHDNAMVLLPKWDPFGSDPADKRHNDLWLVASREHGPGLIGSYRLDYPYWGFSEE